MLCSYIIYSRFSLLKGGFGLMFISDISSSYVIFIWMGWCVHVTRELWLESGSTECVMGTCSTVPHPRCSLQGTVMSGCIIYMLSWLADAYIPFIPMNISAVKRNGDLRYHRSLRLHTSICRRIHVVTVCVSEPVFLKKTLTCNWWNFCKMSVFTFQIQKLFTVIEIMSKWCLMLIDLSNVSRQVSGLVYHMQVRRCARIFLRIGIKN